VISSYIQAVAAAPIGTTANAKMSVTTASATATFTADEVVVGTGFGGQTYRLVSYSKTINLATTGAGGMDAGTAPVSGYVALYAIYNPSTSTSSILATNATSAVMPSVYSAAPYPTGYTASALLTVVPTNSSSQFKVVTVRGRVVGIISVNAFGTAVAVTNSVVSIASIVPPNAVEISGIFVLSASTSSNLGLALSGDTNQTSLQNLSLSNMTSAQAIISSYAGLLLSTPQQFVATATVTAGTPSISASISEYRL